MDFLGFGNGSNGNLNIASPITDAPIDASCSGTGGTKTLNAVNPSFAAGQMIAIIQTRGLNAGKKEVNIIDSYVAGTITTLNNLDNTYTDSGASQAQVIVMEQYSGATLTAALTAKAWNGDIGGLITFVVNGKITVPASIIAAGKGFRGALGVTARSTHGQQGEGTGGDRGAGTTAANGNGGGGGLQGGGGVTRSAGGGGGGHATTGNAGSTSPSGTTGGDGGVAVGQVDLSEANFGGGGGGGGTADTAATYATDKGAGGNGGGGIMIFAREWEIDPALTSLSVGAENGAGGARDGAGGGGGGGAGFIFLKGKILPVEVNRLLGLGGVGGLEDGFPFGLLGGAGAVGRIRLEGCQVTGTTNPAASESEGGFDFCGSIVQAVE